MLTIDLIFIKIYIILKMRILRIIINYFQIEIIIFGIIQIYSYFPIPGNFNIELIYMFFLRVEVSRIIRTE